MALLVMVPHRASTNWSSELVSSGRAELLYASRKLRRVLVESSKNSFTLLCSGYMNYIFIVVEKGVSKQVSIFYFG